MKREVQCGTPIDAVATPEKRPLIFCFAVMFAQKRRGTFTLNILHYSTVCSFRNHQMEIEMLVWSLGQPSRSGARFAF